MEKAKSIKSSQYPKCTLHIDGEHTIVIGEATTSFGLKLPRYVVVENHSEKRKIDSLLANKRRKTDIIWSMVQVKNCLKWTKGEEAVAYYGAAQVAYWIFHNNETIRHTPYLIEFLVNIKGLPWNRVNLKLMKKYLNNFLAIQGKVIQFKPISNPRNTQPPQKLMFQFRSFTAGFGIYSINFNLNDTESVYIGRISSNLSGSNQNHYKRIHSSQVHQLLQKQEYVICKLIQTPISEVLPILESTVQLSTFLAMLYDIKTIDFKKVEFLNIRIEGFKRLPEDCNFQEYLTTIFTNLYSMQCTFDEIQLK